MYNVLKIKSWLNLQKIKSNLNESIEKIYAENYGKFTTGEKRVYTINIKDLNKSSPEDIRRYVKELENQFKRNVHPQNKRLA